MILLTQCARTMNVEEQERSEEMTSTHTRPLFTDNLGEK